MPTPVIHNVEPFDWSNTTTHYSKYDANGLSQIIQFGPGSPALWTMRNNGSNYLGLNVPSSATQGAACIINGTVAAGTFLQFYEGNGVTLHCTIGTDASGHVVAKNGNGTTLGTSTATLAGPWDHAEAIVTCHDTTGAVTVYQNGNPTPILALTNVDTRNGGTGVIDHVRFHGDYSGNGPLLGQLVWHDGSAQLGWRLAQYVPGTSAGTYSNATPSSGTIQSCVDEQQCNGDTDYAAMDDTSLPKNVSVGITLPGGIANLIAVIPHLAIRSDAVGTNTGRVLLRSGSTDDDGGADVSVPLSYGHMRRVLQTDPATSAAWTTSPTLEVGFRRTA